MDMDITIIMHTYNNANFYMIINTFFSIVLGNAQLHSVQQGLKYCVTYDSWAEKKHIVFTKWESLYTPTLDCNHLLMNCTYYLLIATIT